jgi:hypothetical protein
MAERTTRITIETERILILACQRATSGWCERCGSEVEFLPSHEARRVLDAAPEPLGNEHRKSLHLGGAKRSGLQVCLKSLLRFLEAACGEERRQT